MVNISKEEYLERSYQAFLKSIELEELDRARQEEEEALAREYKVDECNTKRAALVEKYRLLRVPVQEQMKAIKKV